MWGTANDSVTKHWLGGMLMDGVTRIAVDVEVCEIAGWLLCSSISVMFPLSTLPCDVLLTFYCIVLTL